MPSPREAAAVSVRAMRALRVGFARWMVATVIPAVFRRVNAATAWVVRSRLHWLLRGSVLVVRCEGRRSGRTYLVPVTCRPSAGGALHALTSARALWWRTSQAALRRRSTTGAASARRASTSCAASTIRRRSSARWRRGAWSPGRSWCCRHPSRCCFGCGCCRTCDTRYLDGAGAGVRLAVSGHDAGGRHG